jgi:hypothetical protein
VDVGAVSGVPVTYESIRHNKKKKNSITIRKPEHAGSSHTIMSIFRTIEIRHNLFYSSVMHKIS